MLQKEIPQEWTKALIIGFGDDLPEELPIEIDQRTLIIAADGGSKYASNWGITPHVVIGDFDSLDLSSQESLVLQNIDIIKFPKKKDYTDVELAINYALEHGVDEIILTGVWGGRLDHSLGNIELLYKLGLKEITASVLTSESQVYLVNGLLSLDLPIGTIVSLIPLSENVTEVSTTGLYFELKKASLVKGSTFTISNKSTSSCIQITKGTGILIVIVELKNPR